MAKKPTILYSCEKCGVKSVRHTAGKRWECVYCGEKYVETEARKRPRRAVLEGQLSLF